MINQNKIFYILMILSVGRLNYATIQWPTEAQLDDLSKDKIVDLAVQAIESNNIDFFKMVVPKHVNLFSRSRPENRLFIQIAQDYQNQKGENRQAFLDYLNSFAGRSEFYTHIKKLLPKDISGRQELIEHIAMLIEFNNNSFVQRSIRGGEILSTDKTLSGKTIMEVAQEAVERYKDNEIYDFLKNQFSGEQVEYQAEQAILNNNVDILSDLFSKYNQHTGLNYYKLKELAKQHGSPKIQQFISDYFKERGW